MAEIPSNIDNQIEAQKFAEKKRQRQFYKNYADSEYKIDGQIAFTLEGLRAQLRIVSKKPDSSEKTAELQTLEQQINLKIKSLSEWARVKGLRLQDDVEDYTNSKENRLPSFMKDNPDWRDNLRPLIEEQQAWKFLRSELQEVAGTDLALSEQTETVNNNFQPESKSAAVSQNLDQENQKEMAAEEDVLDEIDEQIKDTEDKDIFIAMRSFLALRSSSDINTSPFDFSQFDFNNVIFDQKQFLDQGSRDEFYNELYDELMDVFNDLDIDQDLSERALKIFAKRHLQQEQQISSVLGNLEAENKELTEIKEVIDKINQQNINLEKARELSRSIKISDISNEELKEFFISVLRPIAENNQLLSRIKEISLFIENNKKSENTANFNLARQLEKELRSSSALENFSHLEKSSSEFIQELASLLQSFENKSNNTISFIQRLLFIKNVFEKSPCKEIEQVRKLKDILNTKIVDQLSKNFEYSDSLNPSEIDTFINAKFGTFSLKEKTFLQSLLDGVFAERRVEKELKEIGYDKEKWDKELQKLEESIQFAQDNYRVYGQANADSDLGYGVSGIKKLRDDIDQAYEPVKLRIRAISKKNKNQLTSEEKEYIEQAKKLEEERAILCASKDTVLGRIDSAGKLEQLLMADNIDDLLDTIYYDGISEADYNTVFKAKLRFVRDFVIPERYTSEQAVESAFNTVVDKATHDAIDAAIRAGASAPDEKQIREYEMTKIDKEKIRREMKKSGEYYLKFLDSIFLQAGFGYFKVGTTDTDTFQANVQIGKTYHNALLGDFDSKTFGSEQGDWRKVEGLKANQRLNMEILGIREGFDATEQRNTDGGETGGIDYKLQTILLEINDLLGKPYLYKNGFNGPVGHAGVVDTRINSNAFNVDNIIAGHTASKLVDLLVERHLSDLFQYDNEDVIATYKRAIKFLAARNDLTSLNFIKLVGTTDKSLHPSCAPSVIPFGMNCAQVRALYKQDIGGYLALSDSFDVRQAITSDDTYKAVSNGSNPSKKQFFEKVSTWQEFYAAREFVDFPQKPVIQERKKNLQLIFTPARWDKGFMSHTEFACSINTADNGGKEGAVTPQVYLDAASAYMKIFQASVSDIEPDEMNSSRLEARIGQISTQCSILSALTSSSKGDRFQPIIDSATALYASFIEKVLLNVRGNVRKNSLGLIDAYGRDYLARFDRTKNTIIKVLKDPERTKTVFSTKLLEFIGEPGNRSVDEIFMNEPEYTGIRYVNKSLKRNYDFNTALEPGGKFEQFSNYIDYEYGTWRIIDEHEGRQGYPQPILSVDQSNVLSSVIFDKEDKK